MNFTSYRNNKPIKTTKNY